VRSPATLLIPLASCLVPLRRRAAALEHASVSIAKNGEVSVYYEAFGDLSGPVVLLVAGFGCQCTWFAPEFCEMFVHAGFGIIRYDHRDLGLSTKMDHAPADKPYTLSDMTTDAIAVLDSANVDRVHAVGYSMGGMIVQLLAIEYPSRLATATSIMSTTGDLDVGQASEEALEVLLNPPDPLPSTRAEIIAEEVRGWAVWSTPATFDPEAMTASLGAAYDRCYCPEGKARQAVACQIAPSRTEALRSVRIPTLVLHGSRDRLVDISGGRRTAEAIPNARFEVLAGMGHDTSPAYWSTIVGLVSEHARAAEADRRPA
jgi:pimeloyl-ACP methyl ester carboxylesterase